MRAKCTPHCIPCCATTFRLIKSDPIRWPSAQHVLNLAQLSKGPAEFSQLKPGRGKGLSRRGNSFTSSKNVKLNNLFASCAKRRSMLLSLNVDWWQLLGSMLHSCKFTHWRLAPRFAAIKCTRYGTGTSCILHLGNRDMHAILNRLSGVVVAVIVVVGRSGGQF